MNSFTARVAELIEDQREFGAVIKPLLKAREAIEQDSERARRSHCPVNVKFFLEGEEEIGSPSLRRIVERHRDLLWRTNVLGRSTVL